MALGAARIMILAILRYSESPLLSPYSLVALGRLYSSSSNKLYSHMTSLVASAIALYSDSVVDNVTLSCFLDESM